MEKFKEIKTSFLIADLAGYTSLTETHGNLSAANLISRYVEIVNISLKDNTLLKERVGDEILVVSSHSHSLLDTAIELVHNIEREPEFLSVHIGIHTGDVIEQDGNYFGSALNLCSRISSYSRGGQILCSNDVVKEVGNLNRYQFKKVDDVRFKNVSKLVSVYELLLKFPKASIAIDPVCKMQIDLLDPPAKSPYNDKTYYFCSFECLEKFINNPNQYA